MQEMKRDICKSIRNISKKIVRCSVGKSILFYVHERDIPENVEKWVVDQRKKK